ncbi:MAG: hypothetical protein JWN44_6481, partial [Myxococcales bacterium]|nr:hypothetical protein [Myxococcales bacterium]
MSGLISFFGGNSSAPAFAGLKGQTSVYGLPIPIVYGRARIAANLIHLLDQAQSTVQSGGKAASKSGATQYALRAAVALALCEGPIAGVISGWADKSGVRDMSRFTAEGWSVALGTSTQAAWSYLTAHHVSEAVPYQLLAYLRNEGLDMPSGSLANYTWEVDGLLAIGGGNFDAHPKDILVDLVTDVNHGLALPATFFGDLSAYQTYCTAAGLFVSPAYTAQRPGIEHFRELFQASYSAPVWSDGKLKVIPYCDTPLTGNAVTYTPNTTPLYDLNDDHFLREGDEEPVRVTRKRAAEAFNQIFVEGEERYINGASAYAPTVGEAKDQASLELGIFRPAPKISLPLIKSVTILRLLAQYLLQRELNVRCEYRFRLGWKFSLLEPMDLVTLTEASFGLTLTPVRITEMHEIDDGWDVVAEDWPFGTASATAYTTQVGSGSAPFQGIAPGNTNTPAIFESPGPLPTDPLEVCIAAAGGVNWGGCDVHVSTDGTTYHKVGTITKRAAYGTLTASLASAPALPAVDSTHTLAVNIAASGAALASGASTDVAALLTLCYVDGEFLSFATASLTGTGLYSLTTLGRGAYATQPRAHSSGSTFVRCDDAVLHLPFPQGVNGQQLWFKLPAFNIYGRALEDISTVPVFTHTIVDVTA